MKIFVLSMLLSILWIFQGCAAVSVSRLDENQDVDLSGYWNDTDSRLVAEEIVSDCLSRAWLADFKNKNSGKKPRVIVGLVLNKSSEHIAVDTFIKDIERELINSGKVSFVAAGAARDEIRSERADQQRFSADAKAFLKETAADFMLQGSVNSIMDTVGKKTVRFYQVEFELVNMETNEKVWMGQKKIKKLVERSKLKL